MMSGDAETKTIASSLLNDKKSTTLGKQQDTTKDLDAASSIAIKTLREELHST